MENTNNSNNTQSYAKPPPAVDNDKGKCNFYYYPYGYTPSSLTPTAPPTQPVAGYYLPNNYIPMPSYPHHAQQPQHKRDQSALDEQGDSKKANREKACRKNKTITSGGKVRNKKAKVDEEEVSTRKVWKPEEIKKLLSYLKDNMENYKRVKSTFYRKAAEYLGNDTKENSVKNKLADLVNVYQKYKLAENQSGGEVPDEPEFLEILEEIFGSRPNVIPIHLTSNTSVSPQKEKKKSISAETNEDKESLAILVSNMVELRKSNNEMKQDILRQRLDIETRRLGMDEARANYEQQLRERELARAENEQRLKEKELELRDKERQERYELEKMRLELELAKFRQTKKSDL
jgi:hypothetical protein